MEVLYPRGAGLDVHKDTVVACRRVVVAARVEHEVRTFGTTTASLLALADWLAQRGVTHVAMEATGVYWKPVGSVLEATQTRVLANARHLRNVPGRKTDVHDATWIADLLAHGLIRGSFVPPAPIQALRDLTRTRKPWVRERTSHAQRIQKVLEDAHVKRASVLRDVLGQSGRAILTALIDGQTDPDARASLATPRVKASHGALVEARRGRPTPHPRCLLKLHLDPVDAITAAITRVETEIGGALEPFRARAQLWTTIPGVSDLVAQLVVAEIGVERARFPTAGHLISWAGLCPRHDERAGTRRTTRLRKGAPWLKTTLVQAAWAATRVKASDLRAQFLRLKRRRGPKKAIMAVAASMRTAMYFMLRDGVEYQDLGAEYFAPRDKGKTIRRLVRRLEDLGCKVAIAAA
jgi:transposase